LTGPPSHRGKPCETPGDTQRPARSRPDRRLSRRADREMHGTVPSWRAAGRSGWGAVSWVREISGCPCSHPLCRLREFADEPCPSKGLVSRNREISGCPGYRPTMESGGLEWPRRRLTESRDKWVSRFYTSAHAIQKVSRRGEKGECPERTASCLLYGFSNNRHDNDMSIDSPLPAKPIKDPQPSVDRIDDLAKRILTGDIYLPKFQREFVWERAQILNLLDSVTRNYPIGSVLLWQSRQELRSENRIGDLEIALPKPDYPVNYLLDGQQRLSSICGALYWKGTNPDSVWNIAYDLRNKTFHHLDTIDEPPLYLIRLNKIPNPSAYFAHVAAIAETALQERAKELFDRFKDYKVATVTLGDMSLGDVAPIFERINSTDTRLTIVDLMRAATWSPDFDLVDSIDAIRDTLAEKAFDSIDRKAILRNVSAASGGQFTAESIDELRHSSAEDLKKATSETEQSLRRAVDFLSTHVRAPSAAVVPYTNQIVVLAEILRRIPTPTATQWAEIEKWFWRTGISGYFSGWNSGMMASDLAAVAAFANGAEKIAIDIAPAHRLLWSTRQFRGNNAHSKILALILAYQGPMDFITGQKIDVAKALAWQNSKEFHHIFPQAFLKNKGYNANQIGPLANMAYLTSASNKKISDQAPSAYFKKLLDEHGDRAKSWLASNLIDDIAIEAALHDDFKSFLEARSKAIHAIALNMTGWIET